MSRLTEAFQFASKLGQRAANLVKESFQPISESVEKR